MVGSRAGREFVATLVAADTLAFTDRIVAVIRAGAPASEVVRGRVAKLRTAALGR